MEQLHSLNNSVEIDNDKMKRPGDRDLRLKIIDENSS
eukprot:CAMPEP_0170500292 /NCGR_PEP_ID=MMETSP0208-20121228/34353_1 /TAXON_ID=197538 /ORGANISM="Strombidium inclinatum, Strain S3" /LENGTH=36 /DNA_ID= /DNA_START= /DNA_END= /DNA_ORIENTATION=